MIHRPEGIRYKYPLDALKLEIEFYTYSNSDGSFVTDTDLLSVPQTNVYAGTRIPRKVFQDWVVWESQNVGAWREGYWLWTGGMQSSIASELLLLTDDTNSGIFISFQFQNNGMFNNLLGRLADGEEFTNFCGELFHEKFNQISS